VIARSSRGLPRSAVSVLYAPMTLSNLPVRLSFVMTIWRLVNPRLHLSAPILPCSAPLPPRVYPPRIRTITHSLVAGHPRRARIGRTSTWRAPEQRVKGHQLRRAQCSTTSP